MRPVMNVRAQILLVALFLFALPALSQVEPSATGGGTSTGDDTEMMTPPPVSGMPYAGGAGADAQSTLSTLSFPLPGMV